MPLPTDVVFHEIEYGALVSSAPTFVPSTLNCTPATATLSEAVADTVTVFCTVALLAGALIETVGAVVSALLTVTDTVADVVVLPAGSLATAVSARAPLPT